MIVVILLIIIACCLLFGGQATADGIGSVLKIGFIVFIAFAVLVSCSSMLS